MVKWLLGKTVQPKILYLQYTNPAGYPSLEHSSRILARHGWRALFLGTGDLTGSIPQIPSHPNIFVRQLRFCPPGWRQKLHYLFFCLWAMLLATFWRPGWIYCSDILSCPPGLVLSFLRKNIIYHEHDSPYPKGAIRHSLFMRLVLWSRLRLAQRATFCIVPNEERIGHFSDEVGRRSDIMCVWNCPALEEVAEPRQACQKGALQVLYHGSIVPRRLPLAVIDALALLPSQVRLTVVGYETIGHRGYVRQLQEYARGLGISERMECVGTLPLRRNLFELCQGCDVGLSLMPKKNQDLNENNMVGASNKPFDYLACGLALLVSDLSDWRRAYVELGYGLACDPSDPKSIAEVLRWFLEHPTEMRGMGERGRQRILEEWNYEKQFAPALERLRDATP